MKDEQSLTMQIAVAISWYIGRAIGTIIGWSPFIFLFLIVMWITGCQTYHRANIASSGPAWMTSQYGIAGAAVELVAGPEDITPENYKELTPAEREAVQTKLMYQIARTCKRNASRDLPLFTWYKPYYAYYDRCVAKEEARMSSLL